MGIYEKWGYSLLSIIAVIYLIAMFVRMIAAFPYGLLGLLLMAGIGVLLVKVVKERKLYKGEA
jgi:hypothetical protein